MPSFNKVVILGNLTRDPEVLYIGSGTAVCDITLAINSAFKNKAGEKQEECTFVDVTLWGRTAEIAGEYLGKGKPVLIEGRLQQDVWSDKETGAKRSKLKVVAESLQLLGSGPGGGRPPENDGSAASEPTGTNEPDDGTPF